MANTPTSSTSTYGTDRAGTNSPDTAQNETPDLKGDATALVDEAKSAAGKVVDEAKDQVASLTERAKDELGAATDKARSLAADQKDMLADQVGGVAEALGKAASELEQGSGAGAHYAQLIADNAEKLAETIRTNDVDQLLGKAQDFGRQQPALFMGAAALLGFAASRFVLASAKRREDALTSQAPDYQEYGGEPATGTGSNANSGLNQSLGGL
jgi:hypothetical protein